MSVATTKIIDSMPAHIRSKAEAAAAEAGQSLEAYVDNQLETQLSDSELAVIAGGADFSVRADWNEIRGTRVGAGVSVKF